MKAHSSYFRQKNSKKGLALSTTMAICIVLVLLVAILVSIASLNITTTQSTISQREAYIQAKSALAYAEAYYSQHADQIPGNGSTEGEGLIVFNSDKISEGAKVYITKDDSVNLDSGTVQGYKNSAKDTYVEVKNTASLLDLTAYCKYGDGNAYKLSREFSFNSGNEARPNAFTGNIIYKPTSDTRYLRIHVRTNPAFKQQPFLYAWYTAVNNASGVDKGKSSIVNKMSEDTNFATVSNGEWDGTRGPTGECAMTYEGNSWYVTEIKFSSNENVNFVNAVVARPYAHRTEGSNFYRDAQSWEFFGIPVPAANQTGEANGLDVYISLNQKSLKDFVGTSNDEFTDYFESFSTSDGSGKDRIDSFVKGCSEWYSVYTKKDTSTIHYRRAKVYDDSSIGSVSGFTYEGYGWWRNTSNNFSDTFTTPGGTVVGYGNDNGRIVSQNKYGKEVVRELFVVEDEDGKNTSLFATEAEANDWLFGQGDSLAGDYLSINVRSTQQPVDTTVTTKLKYTSEWIKGGGALPTPGSGGDTDSDSDSDSDTEVAYNGSELKIQELAAVSTQPSGDGNDYAIIGFPNNWGLDEGAAPDSGLNKYDNIKSSDRMSPNGGTTYKIVYESMGTGTYEFKVIEMLKNSGLIRDGDFNGWDNAYGNGDDNYSVEVTKAGNNIVIEFDRSTHTVIRAEQEDPEGGGGGGSTSYVIAGWMNGFGTNDTTTVNDYSLTNDMTEDGGTFVYDSALDPNAALLVSGQNYSFKILEKLASSGSIEEKHGWEHAYGGSGDNVDDEGNFVFHKDHDSEGNIIKYTVKIIFDPTVPSIEVIPTEVSNSGSTKFYLVGYNTNWDDQFETAKKFELESTSSSGGLPVYSYNLSSILEPGNTYEFKVISSEAELTTPDADGKTIDYEYSWGKDDGSGSTKGAGKPAMDLTPSKRSKLTVNFIYNKDDEAKSSIMLVPTEYTEVSVGSTSVGFHNAVLEDIRDGSKTSFTTPWEKVYVTFHSPDNDDCLELKDGTTNIWGKVPENATYIYFSNMNSIEHHGEAGYERTVEIPADKFVGITNALFFPKSISTTTSEGVFWSVGDTEEYRKWTQEVKTMAEEVEMAYANMNGGDYASSRNNYYDAPIVKVLNMLNPLTGGKPDGGGAHYAYASYPYQDYGIQNDRFKVSFNEANTISYQGEVYYYAKCQGYDDKWSFLIIQTSQKETIEGKPDKRYKGGLLLENHMALLSDTYYVSTAMNNRGGGVFTSDNNYYNGDTSVFNYNGYSPSWYTVKVPVSTDITIETITGVNNSGEFLKNGTGASFTPAKAGAHFNQPLYIYGDGSDREYYTYDIDAGYVDTNKDDQASIYFEKPSDWSDEVYVHAYNALDSVYDAAISIDTSDSDTNYYRFPFDAGKYCYFVFYDHHEGDFEHTTKKTPIHFFTGVEEDRQYQILAKGMDSGLSFYLHPQTKALNAYLDLDAAYAATMIPKAYSYNAKKNEYTAINGSYTMNDLKVKVDDAKSYAEGSGPWSNSGSADYTDLAKAAIEYSQAISDTRIYISEEIPESVKEAGTDENYTGSGNIYKEGSYRDDIISYETRWVNALSYVYNDALSIYSNGSAQTNPAALRQQAANLYAFINSPEIVLNENAVQIIVNDQKGKDATGAEGGLWGKSNIHLYNYADSAWHDVGYDLYDTTQSADNYYAYVFKLNPDNTDFIISQTAPAADATGTTLAKGTRYIFDTATGVLKIDNSVQTVTCAFNEIKASGASSAYSTFTSLEKGKEFVIYFKNDTKVDNESGINYTIYAGAYTVSAKNYSEFNSDVKKKFADGSIQDWTGINLFTDTAKTFFTTAGRFGMTTATNYTSSWPTDVVKTGNNIDVMFKSLTAGSGTAEASTGDEKSTVAFRFDGISGEDTLTLNRNVVLQGGAAHIAVNNLVIPSGFDFTIKAKTIVFYTDTNVTTPSGNVVRIAHGTYVFNESEDSGYLAEIDLSTTGGGSDWREHYVLIDEMSTSLEGGIYVVNN